MYSQWHEDAVLTALFDDQPTGFFVDVGAHDGICLSNTYRLELAGWSGICIEAHPEYAARCRENRPGSTCIHGACIGEATVDRVTFYAEPGGLFSSLSNDAGPAKRHYRANWGLSFAGFETIEVPALTLDSILGDTEQSIDLVSIDVEGSELDVLTGFDLERYRPRILIIEANNATVGRKITRYLTTYGYVRAGQIRVNSFYCARSDRARRQIRRLIMELRCDR